MEAQRSRHIRGNFNVRSAEETSLMEVNTDMPRKNTTKRRHATRKDLGELKRGTDNG